MRIERFPTLMAAAVLAAFLLPASALAQPSDGIPLGERDWALQFRINQNFTLGSFQGSVISIKRQFSAHSALRLGVSVDVLNQDLDDEVFVPPDSIAVRGRSTDGGAIQVNLDYLKYTRPSGPITAFWGVGPLFTFSSNSTEQFIDGATLRNDRDQWSLGLSGRLGVEWFPTRDFGLHAEYGLSGTYGSLEDTAGRDDAPEQRTRDKTTTWEFGNAAFLFGLSVYF